MKIEHIATASLTVLCACSPAPASVLDVIPGTRVGPITRDASATGLRARLGGANVIAARLDDLGGEGGTTPGVILWPQDTSSRVAVYFNDTVALAKPSLVIISRSSSRWRIPGGVHVGITLDSLEQINGAPFGFLGFFWDQGGYTDGWNGGELERWMLRGMTINVDLTPRCADKLTSYQRTQITGDVEVWSGTPVARSACIVVSSILIGFR